MKIRLNLDALLVLDVVARSQSFAAAADELHRVPSSVTYTIKKLEQNLGVTLFDRQGHRAQLTPTGEALLKEGRDLLNLSDRIERNIMRIETGWEAEFHLAVSDLLPHERVFSLCEEFYQIAPETRLSLSTEVLAGTWDALLSGRADFVIGAPGDGPPGGGYASSYLGDVEFVFAVAPDHPLAQSQEPLRQNEIRRYRAVAAADSSRSLPSITFGLLSGQNVLTVPNLQMKRQAQIRGLGVGYLPVHLIRHDIDAGRLVVKTTEDGESSVHAIRYAWHSNHHGKAMEWFKQRLTTDQSNYDWFDNLSFSI